MATKTDSKSNSAIAKKSGMGSALPVLLILVIVGFAWSFYSYQQAKNQLAVLTDPKQANELNAKQTEELLAKVSKLVVLPNEKNPVVATINDVEVLAATQDFYKDANNGDKLIIFTQSRKAIIYNEAQNKLINVGPILYNSSSGQVTSQTIPADRLTIDLRNGTKTSDLGVQTRDTLASNYSFLIIRLAKAANANYTETTIVDQTKDDKKADIVNALQKQLNAKVVKELPVNETTSSAEVVVILGKK